MGYDMYVVTKDGVRLSTIDHPRPEGEFDKEWYDRAHSDEYYLRRNIGAQPNLRADLVACGAAFDTYDFASGWSGNQHVMGREFPERPQPYEDHFAWDDEKGEEVALTDEGREFHEDAEKYLRWRPEHPGIPIHKLCDNSGWWVTADECEEALGAIAEFILEHGALPNSLLAEYGDELQWDPWADTLTFLRSAAEHGGFRVY